jgi:hypothetical protein
MSKIIDIEALSKMPITDEFAKLIFDVTILAKDIKVKYTEKLNIYYTHQVNLSPKRKVKATTEIAEQVATTFTESHLRVVNTLLSDDYRCGFKEGVQKFIENGGLSNGS